MIEIDAFKKLGEVDIRCSFKTESRGVTALFGPSGAGKTSVINMIAGLITPDRGKIIFNGKPFFDSEKNINVPVYKRAVGYVFQDARLFPNMSVRKNLLYGSKRVSEKPFTSDLKSVCGLLGIEGLLERAPARLSGGEKQRVAIGRALLSNPEILLMDEPLASLDSERREELLDYISLIPEKFDIPIFYVSHSTREIIRLADNLALMEKGLLKDFGGAVDILNKINSSSEAAGKDFGVVCEGEITSYDENSRLASISFGGGLVEVSAERASPGDRVRFRVNAVDVVVSSLKPPVTSVRNVYKGPVSDIRERPNHFTDILIDIGVPLWARLTSQSVRDLEIGIGKTVYALVKSAVISDNLNIFH